MLGAVYAGAGRWSLGSVRRGGRGSCRAGRGRRHPGRGRPVPAGPPPHPGGVDRRFNRRVRRGPDPWRRSAPGCATRSTWTTLAAEAAGRGRADGGADHGVAEAAAVGVRPEPGGRKHPPGGTGADAQPGSGRGPRRT
jgi:hypothetical protein